MIPINMPQVGQDIPSGTIVEWLKKENDPVQEGEVVLTVESDKAVFEVEAEGSGILLKILHKAGDEVDILTPVGFIGQPGEVVEVEKIVADEEKGQEGKKVPPKSLEHPETAERPAGREPSGKIFVSPVAKRAAQKFGIDLIQIKGTGPRGRITKDDVMAEAGRQKTEVGRQKTEVVIQTGAPALKGISDQDTVIVFGKMRKRIAERLTLSTQTIPHFYIAVDADVTDLLKWRKGVNRDTQVHISITDCVIKATARALAEFERMNLHVDADKMVVKKDINIGVAVSVDDGLLVPVLTNADQKSLREIAELSKRNAEAARRGSINPNDVGTFTISTLGMYGIRRYQAIINPPEAAILAVGSAEKQVVHVDGKTAVRDVMSLTLACDHRAVDGTYAAEFLNRIKCYLENVKELADSR